MGLINFIQSLLGKPNQTSLPINTSLKEYEMYKPKQQAEAAASAQNYEAYLASRPEKIAIEAEAFIHKYGSDFFNFLYQSFTDQFIRLDVLPFRAPDSIHNNFFDNDHWKEKHPFNFPGPFYAGESDTCCTGPPEAPQNVMLDADSCEFIFKQPQSYIEFLCVLDAAAVEIFDSYSCNGNDYWTYQSCKDWWKNKDEILNALRSPEFKRTNGDDVQLYIDYLKGNAATDLRKYCYFLENGVYPDNTAILPPL